MEFHKSSFILNYVLVSNKWMGTQIKFRSLIGKRYLSWVRTIISKISLPSTVIALHMYLMLLSTYNTLNLKQANYLG